MRKMIAGLAALTMFLLLATGWAGATRIKHMGPREVADHSSLVVTGRVTDVSSFWNEAHTKIFTRTLVAVDETFKGTGGSSVELIQLGGVVGNVRVNVEGALAWKEGEEVLLFLEPYGSERYQVTGMSLGKYEIERDPDTGEAYVTRAPLEGVRLMEQDGSTPAKRNGGTEKVRLGKFISEIIGVE